MSRKILILFLLATAVSAAVIITTALHHSEQQQELGRLIESFALDDQPVDFESAQERERKIAAYGETVLPKLKMYIKNHSDVRVRAGCVRAVGLIHAARSGPLLLEVVRAERHTGGRADWYVLASALYSLGLLQYEPAADTLTTILQDSAAHVLVRQQAAVALSRVSGDRSADTLLAQFRADRPAVCRGVVEAFQYLSLKDGSARLLKAYIRQRQDSTRRLSLRVLSDTLNLAARKKNPAALDPLREILAWKWDEKDVLLNNHNFRDEVGPITFSELMATLAFAIFSCSDGKGGMDEVLAQVAADPARISLPSLPEAIALYFNRLRQDNRDARVRAKRNTAAARTIGALVDLLESQHAAARALAYAGLQRLGLKTFPYDPTAAPRARQAGAARHKKWWRDAKPTYDLWSRKGDET